MRFSLLGPLTVGVGPDQVMLRAGIPQAILASLLLNPNTVVSRERLADWVWGEDRPAAAAESLRNHVSRLRRTVGSEAAARIRTVAPGYVVDVHDGELDTVEFLQQCRAGRQKLQDGDWAAAGEMLAGALALWRGEPFADFADSAQTGAEIQLLQETRLLALESRIEAELHLGRHRELIGEIRTLILAHPLREAFHEQLMLALFRSARQSEALEVFQLLRTALVTELGVEPSESVRELHQRILHADPTLTAPAPAQAPETAAGDVPRSRPQQLPADSRLFTGRDVEIGELAELAQHHPESDDAGAVQMSVIDGMAGVGKTALALHLAHLVRERFRDGQLFIDLHGHTPGMAPLTAEDALDRLLRSLDVPPQLIPRDQQGRAAYYRDRLAGTRTLIVLDNAASGAQVRPLLPGTGRCLVLVTGRKRLTGLDDAHTLALGLLSPDAAKALLVKVAGPDRVRVDHPALEELIALCGHLPLAVRIVGARLRHRRLLRVEEVVEDLRDEHHRLGRLRDEDRNLAAVFETSFTALPEAERQMFRRLGQVPGPDFDAYAAACLGEVSVAAAEQCLEQLLDHNLLIQHAPRRYRFHDLVRLYARSLLGEPADPAGVAEREAALARLLDYYEVAADAADRNVARVQRSRPRPTARPAAAPPLSGWSDSLAWLRAERVNLLALRDHAGERGDAARVVSFTAALSALLVHDGPWPLAAELHETAILAARGLDNRRGAAELGLGLGRLRVQTGDLATAIVEHERALAYFRSDGDRLGEANACWDLGRAHHMARDNQTATAMHERALALYQDMEDRQGEANVTWGLGRLRRDAGDQAGAELLLQRSLTAFRELGDRLGEANALWELGRVRQVNGDYRAAVELLDEALAAYRVLGQRLGEANALCGLGRVHLLLGDYAAAAPLLERALSWYQDHGELFGLTIAKHDLGRVRLATGEHAEARRLLGEVLTTYREADDPIEQANVLHELGRLGHAAGEYAAGGFAEAAENFRLAAELFDGAGNRRGRLGVLLSAAALTEDTDGAAAALPVYQEAVELARGVGSAQDEARALAGVARCRQLPNAHRTLRTSERPASAI